MAGFYVVRFGAQERGTWRIEIRFYGEIWQDIYDKRVAVPHGKNEGALLRALFYERA